MIQDSVARHLERHRLARRHAVAVARDRRRLGVVSREAQARRICDGVVRRSLNVFGHSCPVEGAQVCLQRLQAHD